jgi:transmembrane sensor
VRADPGLREHPERLLDRALRGGLDTQDQAVLDRHLTSCPDCATEVETARIFKVSVSPRNRDAALDRAAIENVLARVQQSESFGARLRRWVAVRRLGRPVAALAALGATAAIALGLATHHARQTVPVSVATSAPTRTLLLDDGSEVAPVEGTTVQLAEQMPERTTVRLRSGAAQFRIRHNPQRMFRVDAGPIQIEDLGTVFGVDHRPGGKVHVVVFEGRVAVLSVASGVRFELGAGDDRVFPITPEAGETPRIANEAPPEQASEQATAPATTFAGTLHGQARSRSGEDPAALLLAADQARRSRHPQAAVEPLRRLIERYPRDPRAPSAAFTLGWVLLTDLARPREAAVAFAETERSAPRGTLAEDAAARVAEAWQKAGDSRRAAEAARHYEHMYPSGRYVTLMRGLVGEH